MRSVSRLKMLKAIIILLSFAVLLNAQHNPNFVHGRNVIVQLFEWRWDDIAEECERFLGPYGYGGVQVSPVNENILELPKRPWSERYQPVSYSKLITRSGNEDQFKSMVRRCNQAGVRIYVDAVINHMGGYPLKGKGTGGSDYDAGSRQYPEYSPSDFNDETTCPSASGQIEDYSNPVEVRNCQLDSLIDLKQGKDYVREHITAFLNRLVSYGVAGFRVDAAKHMWPEDLKRIFDGLGDLPTEHGFAPGSRAFVYQEVQGIDEPIQGSDYFHIGRVTEFRFGKFLAETFRGYNQLKLLVNWGPEWGMHPDPYALVFIDNHDNQRGHGMGGYNTLTFRDSRLYKMATAFMLAHPYGATRVMSSYYWERHMEDGTDKNDWFGPPNSNGETLPVIINPDLTCGNGWVCEHRWRQIFHMVKFRNVVEGTSLNDWWDNGSNQIAFCRGGKGFIAINGENYALNESLQTCLPAGQYCDVITGSKYNGACTGNVVTVNSDGRADIYISNETEVPVIAIHVESKL